MQGSNVDVDTEIRLRATVGGGGAEEEGGKYGESNMEHTSLYVRDRTQVSRIPGRML